MELELSAEEIKAIHGVAGRIAYISGECYCGGSLWYGLESKDFKCDYCGKLFTEDECPHQGRP